MDPNDYIKAVDGEGDPILVANWKDKPHRLVYDLVDDNKILRKLLCLRHDPEHYHALYCDDGELQCGICLIDFKRDSALDINQRLHELAFKKWQEQQSTKG